MRQTLLVTSQTAMFFPGSDWRPATAISAADFVQNLLSIDGPGECKPGMQLAAVRTESASAGGAITNGSYRSSAGFLEFRESISGASAAYVRFGTMGRLQAGQSGQSLMVVETDLTVDDCGGVIGGRGVDVQPYLTGVDDANAAIFTVTDWKPTLRVSKLKGMAVVQDNQNTSFEYAFMVRTCVDRSAPAAWVALEAAFTNPEGWVLVGDVRDPLVARVDAILAEPLSAGDRDLQDALGELAAYDARVADFRTYVATAVAMLREHADLVAWALCLVATHTPRLNDEERVIFQEAVMTAILPPFGRHPYRRNIYLIDSFAQNPDDQITGPVGYGGLDASLSVGSGGSPLAGCGCGPPGSIGPGAWLLALAATLTRRARRSRPVPQPPPLQVDVGGPQRRDREPVEAVAPRGPE